MTWLSSPSIGDAMTHKTPPTTTTAPDAAPTAAGRPRVKTYAAEAGPQAGMPTSLFDPAWNNPSTAARVAWMLSRRAPAPDPAVRLEAAPSTHATHSDERLFMIPGVLGADKGARFKGGSYGELHRRYAFGAHTANFHAQSVAFGVDDRGHFFLTATVGRFDGPWGNEGLLGATFMAGADVIGAVVWRHVLDPVGDHKMVLSGQDDRIAARFAAIDRVRVVFVARTGVVAAVDDTARPRLSRARRFVLEGELKSALRLTGPERAQRLLKLVSGLHDDDVAALAGVGGAAAQPALIVELRGLVERAP